MRLLLDTHILLWAIAEPARLPKRTRVQLESAENDVLFSAASIWELAIKMQTGRLQLPVSLEDLSANLTAMGFAELPVKAVHAAGVSRLPLHHRDPFDRLLISQAMLEPARLLTVDGLLGRYSDLVEVVSPRA
jgi:PIN domain nuclease of toxin-antitoxin system